MVVLVVVCVCCSVVALNAYAVADELARPDQKSYCAPGWRATRKHAFSRECSDPELVPIRSKQCWVSRERV